MKTILHPDVVARSGRVGDYVFMYRKDGKSVKALARQFVPPYNPDTPYQQAQRTIFAVAQSGWYALTAVIRAAWDDLATTYYTDIVDPNTGGTYSLSGQSVYIAAQIYALQQGAAAVGTTAPVDTPIAMPVYAADIAAVSATGVFTINPSFAVGTANVRVRLSPAYIQGYAPNTGALRNPMLASNLADNWDAGVDLSADAITITSGAAFALLKPTIIPTTLDWLLVEIICCSETDNLPPASPPQARQLQITVT